MKMKILVMVSILIAGCLTANEKAAVANEATSEKRDVVGEAFNSDNKPVEAVSYGAGRNPYTVNDEAAYMKPEMVQQIAEVVLPPKPGPVEAVDEVMLFFTRFIKL